MSSVPSLTAHASSILALAVFRASWIARFLITFRASPIIVAPENPYFLQPLKIQFQFSRNNCNITMKFLQWNQTSNHIENKAVKLRFNLSLRFKDIKIAFQDSFNVLHTSSFHSRNQNPVSRDCNTRFKIIFRKCRGQSLLGGMRSALSPKCKIDSLRVESLRREGKGHGFRQVPNSSSAGGNFLRLQTLFLRESGGDERGASFRIWEKRSSFASLILTKGREGGKGGRSSRVVISWRPPLRQSLFLAIFHLLSLRLFVPPISPAIYSFLAPAL